jgi:hypothetical protein
MAMQAPAPMTEIAEILALALTRLLARKSSEFSRHLGESSLPLSPGQSGVRPIPENGEKQ